MAKQTATPAKRASRPIKGTPRPKSTNAKVTPSPIKKQQRASASTSKKRSAKKPTTSTQSTRKAVANNRSSVSPIKELSFTGNSGEQQDSKTPVKQASASKRKPQSSIRKSTASRTPAKSATKQARPTPRSSSRPSTPSNKASVSHHHDTNAESSLTASLQSLREYCSIM